MLDDLPQRIPFVIVLLLSLSVHEWAHAWSAFRLGDDTASQAGRLTLNPIPHIDPIGTILLPLLGIPFGWAKPVPVNPARFNRGVSMRTGMMITAAAGPLSNIALALAGTIVLAVTMRIDQNILREQPILWAFLMRTDSGHPGFIPINFILAIFNMLPVYPLDGSRVVDGLIPYRFRGHWETFARYSPLLLIVVLISDSVRNVLLGPPMAAAWFVFDALLGAIAG